MGCIPHTRNINIRITMLIEGYLNRNPCKYVSASTRSLLLKSKLNGNAKGNNKVLHITCILACFSE